MRSENEIVINQLYRFEGLCMLHHQNTVCRMQPKCAQQSLSLEGSKTQNKGHTDSD